MKIYACYSERFNTIVYLPELALNLYPYLIVLGET